MSGREGFSLLEVVIVSSLLAVVSLAAFSGLAVGVQVWKRSEASVQELDMTLGWKRFRKDLLGQFAFRDLQLTGTPQEVSFPSLVAVAGADGLAHQEVGRIRYRFDTSGQHLCREEMAYRDLVQGQSADCRPVISSVGGVVFTYFGMDAVPGSLGTWRTDWEEATPPLAVRMELAVTSTGGESEIARQYTAVLP